MKRTGWMGPISPAPADEVTRRDARVRRALRRLLQLMEIQSRQLETAYDVTGPQVLCLGVLQSRGPLTATQIAEAIQLSPSTVVGILDRLQEKGLVTRKRDREDRRLVHVSMTPRGRKTLDGLPPPFRDGVASALKRAPAAEQEAIATALERLVELIAEDQKPVASG